MNRLTRELSALRAQHSASVASNASHSSAASNALIDPADPNPAHQITGPTHPTPSRHHRSSSSVSGRSTTTPATSTGSATNAATTHISMPTIGQSQASADRAAAARAGTGTQTGNLSRQPSTSGPSGTSTPARPSFDTPLPHRPSISQSPSFTSQHASSTYANPSSPSLSSTPAFATPAMASISSTLAHPPSSGNWADAERSRAELEIVKAENEGLRQRIRSLERALRQRRESGTSDVAQTATGSVAPVPRTRESSETRLGGRSGAGYGYGTEGRVGAWAAGTSVAGPRERSESQSTTASSRRGPVGEDRDEVVRVGESAGNAGLR